MVGKVGDHKTEKSKLTAETHLRGEGDAPYLAPKRKTGPTLKRKLACLV